MIDGESSKAELLQSSKCSSGDITAVILTSYLIKTSQALTAERHEKLDLKMDVCTQL